MKLIYENDIPKWPIRNETEKFVSRWNDERTGRWKPNGISDNRMEWALKDGVKASTALKTVLHIYRTQTK